MSEQTILTDDVGAPPGPPLGIPSRISFDEIDPDTSVQAEGGGTLTRPVPPSVVAGLEGADAAAFTVIGLETLHLVRDPDAPNQRVWETLASVDGAGPISLAGAQALGVFVEFDTPTRPIQTSFSAVAVVVADGTTGPPVMQIPIDATVNPVGHIRVIDVGSSGLDGGFLPGQTASLIFKLESTLDHEVSGSFACDTSDQTAFSSPAVPVSVPADGDAPVTLPVTCAPGTAPGQFDGVIFAFTSGDPAGHGGIALDLTVLEPRSVVVTTNLPHFLELDPDAPLTGTVTANDSGGFSDPTFSGAVLPDGVTLNVGPLRQVGGGPIPGSERVLEADLTIAVAPGAAVGPRHTPLIIAWDVPADGNHPGISGSLSFVVDVLAPHGAPIDGQINWELANQLGIQVDASADGWNAGRVHDVISLPSGALLIGLNYSGVWTVTPEGEATPHSDDWDNVDINCLARGPDDPNHFYAGCGSGGALYESDPSSAIFGFLAWHQVAIADSSGTPFNTGDIMRIAVVETNRKLVLACLNGLFWADIPPLGGTYNFKQAVSPPGGDQYSGAAPGPGGSVLVGAWGDAKHLPGIYFGDWSSGDLVLQKMVVPGEADIHWISLASSQSDPNRMYAACSDSEDRLLSVLRHDHIQDGMTWQPCDTSVTNAPSGMDLPSSCGDRHNGGWIKLLHVAPTHPDTVVINWSQTFINFGGGQQPWVAVDRVNDNNAWKPTPQWNSHMHADGHTTVFDANDEATLYIASDGGVGMTPDLGKTYVSKYNERLPTLLVDSLPNHESGGTLSAGPVGLLAGSLQDNGDVYCNVAGDPTPWRRLEGGDGLRVRFLPVGQRLIWYINDNIGVHASRWDGTGFVDTAVIPRADEFPLDNGLISPAIEIVDQPTFRDSSNRLMVAVGCAAGSGDIYGLFVDDDGGNPVWQSLGFLPPSAAGAVSTLGSLRGDSVWIGTDQGEIFSMGSQSGSVLEFATPRPTTAGQVDRFVIVSDELAYAIYNRRFDGDVLGPGLVLQLNFFSWDPLGSNGNVAAGTGLPSDAAFYAMAIDRVALPHTLFVAADRNVYVSRDEAQTWQVAPRGLPRQPHCADLRVDPGDGTSRFLYLGTFGRSVWRAPL